MKRLMVIVPGLRGKSSQWGELLDKLAKEPEWASDTKVFPFDHGATVFTRASAADLAARLALLINGEWLTNGPYDDVILMGHSMGALLVRQAYLTGLGGRAIHSLPKAWSGKVSRLVLFSGINRGVRLEWHQKLLLPMLLPGSCLLRDVLIGSDFITNLRLWWIKKLAAADSRPLVIQLRGALDKTLDESDSLDIEGFLEGYQMLVPEAKHADIMALGNSTQRYEILRQAVLRPFNSSSQIRPDPAKKVFFVVHGIRDNNDDWVEAVKTMIEQQIPNATVIPPTFGRFSALQFVLPFLRRRRVRWFQDLYSMELSKNPRADFYFVGHSYGTYLLGHGLSKLSGMTFDRVALCGSVLPSQWEWDRYRGQVNELRNARSRYDLPVGVLCNALRGLGMKDIGTAGYSGFQIPPSQNSENFFYNGGHGESVAKGARPDILTFLTSGLQPRDPKRWFSDDPKFSQISAASPALPYVLFILILAIAGAWTATLGPHSLLGFSEAALCLLIGFVSLLFLVLAFI